MAIEEAKRPVASSVGCANCGRGEIRTDLLLEEYRGFDTSLHIVACTDTIAHTPPGGRHIGRCRGFVYVHRDTRICAAVKRIGAAVTIARVGGN
jgi:hypothetical protein